MMTLVKYKTNGHNYLLTFRVEHSWRERLRAWWRKEKLPWKTVEYFGSGTVWRTYPGMDRCNVMLEGTLAGVYTKLRHREEQLRKETTPRHGHVA